MKTVRLYSGFVETGPQVAADALPDSLDRAVVAVYAGTFLSMDGEVTITEAHVNALADNHNRRVAESQGKISLCPPLQLDHSKGARETIGRVHGLARAETRNINGKDRLALVIDSVRFLGRENVAPAVDGRWSSVSIGANLETCTLDELSITPFPAAEHAALLSKGAGMPTEKMKKKLMEKAKCSAEEADEKLAKMSDDDKKSLAKEVDDEEKKLAEEEDEKKKKLAADEDEKKKDLASGDDEDKKDKGEEKKLSAKLTAAKTQLAALNTELRSAQVELHRTQVGTRLSSLRSKALVTPAELKKLAAKPKDKQSIAERIALASDEARQLVWDVMEAREAVVPVGQIGSLKVVDLSAMGEAQKQVRLSELEKEARASMPFTAGSLVVPEKNEGGAHLSIAEQFEVEEAKRVRLAAQQQTDDIEATRTQDVEALTQKIARLSASVASLGEALND